MIAMSSSARNFGALAQYLAKGRSGDEPERVAWSASRNLPTDDPELAGKIMRATAAQNVRVKQPVYHLALSFDPGDQVDRIAMERVADRVIAALELQGHQIVIVSHRDRGHPHMHLLVNRVHPETGLVWNRWQDRAVIQQVLREQEEALGLRIVPGRLAVREQPTLDVVAESKRSREPEEKAADPAVERQKASEDAPPKISKVDEVAGHLRNHERATELVRGQYTAEMEANAARARAQQLDEAVHRAETTRGAFDRALSAVYRDPVKAQERFTVAVERKGLTEATRTMREQPEEYGELVAVEKPRAFGLGRTLDDTEARSAAVGAAIKGREAIEADQSAQQIGLGVRARRLDTAWSRELGDLFEDPAAARAAFERQAREHGPDQAVKAVRERPEELGKVRPDLRADPQQVTAKAERVSVIGLEVINAGQIKPGGRPTPGFRIDVERTASRDDAERAGARQAAIRNELRTGPDRADLERRVVDLIDRMSPREVRQLRTTLTAPQIAVALKLKASLKDALLGRDEAHQR
jgi:hypothetical protein